MQLISNHLSPWANSRIWWRTGKPGVHGVTKSQTQPSDWTTRLDSILADELSNFHLFIFIVCSSLLQWSVFLSIIFLNSFYIFITSFLNLGSSRLVRSASLCVLSEYFSCSFNWNSVSAFLFSLTFSVCMNLGVTVIYCGFEGLCICENIPV